MIRLLASGSLLLLTGCRHASGDAALLRIGHLPNVTHAHGLVAHAMSRGGRGFLEQRLGPGVRVEWYAFNAGPSAMEAMLAGSLDATYVGPSPAINAHVKTRGEDIRILAGATEGGEALVVRRESGVKSAADLRGRRIATPQLGNTQDVACRAWLVQQGYEVTQTGGDVLVVPTANPDQLALFQKGELDAAWTVEPWVTRLEREAGGAVLVADPGAITTVLVASARLLEERPQLAAALRRAHHELTVWIGEHPGEARRLARAELEAITRLPVSEELVACCWQRMRLTEEVHPEALVEYVDKAKAAGFLPDAGDLGRLFHKP